MPVVFYSKRHTSPVTLRLAGEPVVVRVGDRIRFRAVTRFGADSAVRVVKGFHGNHPLVRFNGWDSFVVSPDEVSSVVRPFAPDDDSDRIQPGDRVKDPLDGEWRTVSHVVDDSVFMQDGGVMGLQECRAVLLPSEMPDS